MTRRGWCPSLFSPMQTGDGLLLRLKPRLGVLTAPTARSLADASAQLGNGILGLTNRGNLQLRGFTEASAATFAEIAISLGLAMPDPAAEARRCVLAPPLIGLDPELHPSCFDIARELDDSLASRAEFSGLPGKFGIVVDGGGALPLAEVKGDILVQPDGDFALISLDGGQNAARVRLALAVEATLNVVRSFLDADPVPRMRDADPAMIFAASGLPPRFAKLQRTSRPAIGELPGAIGLGMPFGMMRAEDLVALADLAEMRGDTTLRLTPFRAILVPGVKVLPRLVLPTTHAILDPLDPLLRVEACPGAPACMSATVDTLAAGLRAAAEVTWQDVLHVSGCAKGCAHSDAASVALVGHDGAWDLVRHGRAGDAPILRGLSLESILAQIGIQE